MALSVQSYSIAWSDHFIHRVERLLREVHVAVGELYDAKAYPRRVALKVLKSSGKSSATAGGGLLAKEKDDGSLNSPEGTTMDVISSAGSFMLRTSVHRTPFEDHHTETGIGIDVVLTIPEQVCSEEDLRNGCYLSCRDAFLHEVLDHLNGIQQRAAAAAADEGQKHDACKEGEEEEGMQKNNLESAPSVRGVKPAEEKESNHSRSAKPDEKSSTFRGRAPYASVGVPKHFARMNISVLPIHDCYGCQEKKIIRLRWYRKGGEIVHNSTSSFDDANDHSNIHLTTKSARWTDSFSSSGASSLFETVYVDIHFRPAMHSARVTGAKSIHKHPLYSYLILEDYWMPVFLEKLHRLCVDSPGLRRTIVLLKCWALHLGLHAPSSGNAEGLNGFLISAMVLYLIEEEGVLSHGMSEETAARTVLAYISGGGFTKAPNATEKALMKLPTAEENGDVAVMRFAGDAFNLLFRTSAAFFKLVVERAAQESLMYAKISELFLSVPFQPLAFRHDLCLTLHHCPSPPRWEDAESPSLLKPVNHEEEEERDGGGEAKGTPISNHSVMHARRYFSPSVSWAQHTAQMAMTALQSRAEGVTVWPTGASTLQMSVLLNHSAESRRRLTKGPIVEEEEAVKAFNTFWGVEKTSTRQFADGAIYRCVLWDFPDYLPVEQMTALIVQYALRRQLGGAGHSARLPSLPLYSTMEDAKGQSRKEVEVKVLLGGLESFLCERIGGGEWKDVQPLVKKSLWEACKCVREVIAHLPDSTLPCKIVDFDFISASERCTEVFPVRPHLALTCTASTLSLQDAVKQYRSENGGEEVNRKDSPPSQDMHPVFPSLPLLSSKATIEPIHCVLTIDDNRRIPDNLEATQLMKAAIGAQLSKVLQAIYGSSEQKKVKEEVNEKKKKEVTVTTSSDSRSKYSTSRGSSKKSAEKSESSSLSESSKVSSPLIYASCHPHGVDIICHGFLFRVYVAHYREISLLRALQMSAQADILERKLFWAAQHAKFIRSIVYGHASFSVAVRLAKRWISAMCLYEFILPEAVELLVAHAYLKSHEASYQNSHPSSAAVASLVSPPRTALAGFMRFMELLSTHNWETPLVLPSTDMAMHTGETEAQSALQEGSRRHSSASTTAAAHALWREEQQKSRGGSSSCAMFIAAPYAPTQSPFTVDTPRKMVLHRLVALSKAAFSVLLHHVCRPLAVPEKPPIIPSHVFSEDASACRPSRTTSEEPFAGTTEAALFHPSLSAFDLALCFHPSALLHHDKMIIVPFEEAAAEAEAERVWQLDELGQSERMHYLARRVERDPAGQTVRLVRQALRDKAMAFYDVLAPTSALFLVALQDGPPTQKVMEQMAGEAIHAARGAILSSPVVFLRCSSSVSLQSRFQSSFLSTENKERQKKKAIKDEAGFFTDVSQQSCLSEKRTMVKERTSKEDTNSKKSMKGLSHKEDIEENVIEKDKRIKKSQSANTGATAVAPKKRARDIKAQKEEEVHHKRKEKKK